MFPWLNQVLAPKLSCLNSSPWIIDSGATDHMTSSFCLFGSYSPVYCNEKIRITEGSFTSIEGKGTIPLTTKLTLRSILHVPKLAWNLLSVRGCLSHQHELGLVGGVELVFLPTHPNSPQVSLFPMFSMTPPISNYRYHTSVMYSDGDQLRASTTTSNGNSGIQC